MYLIFDTETTGIPRNKTAPLTDFDNWPRLVQLAWQLHDPSGNLLNRGNLIIRPEGFDIPFRSQQVHGISTARALEEGKELDSVLKTFTADLLRSELIIGHNIEFDINIIGAELLRKNKDTAPLLKSKKFDTSTGTIDFCSLPGGPGGKFKMPKLNELHRKLFNKDVSDAHDAAYDVDATARCFFELLKIGVAKSADNTQVEKIKYQAPDLEAANFSKKNIGEGGKEKTTGKASEIKGTFFHLHLHSQYSVLQATADISEIIAKTKEAGMQAVALTDFGNLYGAFSFVSEALKHNIKPILGCEYFLAEERLKNKFTKESPDRRYNQILIAKTEQGYRNLAKLSSLGFTEGLYGIHPRIDKELVKQYREGLIATTGGLMSEIPHLIIHTGIRQAEEAFKWWHKLFGDDFYVELNRHGLPEEDHVNQTLLEFCRKYKVRYFPANEVYYLGREDANAHDVLVCIKEGEFKSTPIGEGRGKRYGLPNSQYYFKTRQEMAELFKDLPESFETLEEIFSKIETFKLEREVLLPRFDIPKGFDSEDEYLRHLTYQGAEKRYPELTPAITERIDFELETIKKTGYPGYFLIVADLTSKARELGVSVGPGRGSAAGSVVAYCTGITNVDPIAYDLLFERFLNPDRVSLPDIDIDFDDEGREKVIDYVINKYGARQVAQIITYGTMAAKSSIRDCARVMELSLPDANSLAKLVPERPGTTLTKAFDEVPELKDILKGQDLRSQVLKQAKIIEGSVRNTGTHACGVIITPRDMTELIPVSTAKDSTMLVTQFDNAVVEKAGMLKMDFLGLTTLSIIRTAVKNIKKRHGIEPDIDKLPLDDLKTYQLYQRGETTGTFQFESDGMQAYLKQLKPDKFEDLIAMNALYRPGPMEYIPTFIARKHGREKITYDHPDMEEYLKDTYGITVYQEQVMLLAQKLAGFTKGEADILRKAMGKKLRDVLDKQKGRFTSGCNDRGYPVQMAEKVWKDWEAFAEYAFNKSHSTCYSMVAYQTAWLKANYPAEYMAAVLSHSQSNIENVTFFAEECRRMGIPVLGPHVNESGFSFEVNNKGEIRFGLGAIKGTGDAAVEAIINERSNGGAYKDIFDFAKRLSQRSVNKKTYESLALSGAFDCFSGIHRRQYIAAREGDSGVIDKAIKFASRAQQEETSSQTNLFGGGTGTVMPQPKIEPLEPFSEIEKLNFEREVVGVYISGHPLDSFRFEMETFCNTPLAQLNALEEQIGKDIRIGGIVSSVEHRVTKSNKPFGKLVLEDYSGKNEFVLWSEDYLKFKSFLTPGYNLFIEGTVARRSWGNQEAEFRFKSMDLLNEIGLKRTRSIQISIEASDIDKKLMEDIEAICKAHQGNIPLLVSVRDSKENIAVELLSRKFNIKPVEDSIRKFRRMPQVMLTVS